MNKVQIIAEAGVNHNGDILLAKQLIDAAVTAGVDYIKFQTFKAEKIASRFADKAEYQKKSGSFESQVQMLKKLELSEDMHVEIIRYCKQKGVQFLSTAFDKDSIILLHTLGVSIGKIPSGEITNYPYLQIMGDYFNKIIISTGMATMEEVENALDLFLEKEISKENITVLHCNTEYPTPFSDVNLKAMETLRNRLQVNVGYSDHTLGIEVPIAAVAMGATVIEKHFTLDRNMEGPDHVASLEPGELKQMVQAIRNIEQSIGDGIKRPSASEQKNIAIARRSIVAARSIHEGEIFSEDNITTKRPGNGMSPMLWKQVLGKKAKRDFENDELIEL